MRYSNPLTGGYPMTTIAAFVQLLPKGFETARYRSTDATIFVAVEGRGRTRIGPDFVVEWRPRDISMRRPTRRCSSRFRTVPCRRRCSSTARSATMPETHGRGSAAADQLIATTDEILAEVQQLPPEIIHWVPAEGVWTVMDNLCHIREFVPFWTGETLRIVQRSSDPWGRDHTDTARLAAVTNTARYRHQYRAVSARRRHRRYSRRRGPIGRVVEKAVGRATQRRSGEQESPLGRQTGVVCR
jgi:hypothetical protein